MQVTIPKVIAERYGIEPGAEIDWLPAGDAIRVVPPRVDREPDWARRLELFDGATERQRLRQAGRCWKRPLERGWTREELYERGSPR